MSKKKTVKKKSTKKKTAAKTAKNELTDIICVIDRSMSIGTNGLVETTIEGFNAFLADQKKAPGRAKLTLCLFDGSRGYRAVEGETYEIIHDRADIGDVPELSKTTFVPRGMTALYDAIGVTIDRTTKRLEAAKGKDKADKVIMLIMTDGEENSSREYNKDRVASMIKEKKEKDKWGIIFIGANIDTMREGTSMGVSTANNVSYSSTRGGTQKAMKMMSKSVTSARAMGASAYAMSTDNLVVNIDDDLDSK